MGHIGKIRNRWGSIFVKKVPLNEIERKPENIRSTENLFGIPLYYQYGVGSGGFSVWRELSAHIMSTEWVLSSENGDLPLMYHWRIINNSDEYERRIRLKRDLMS